MVENYAHLLPQCSNDLKDRHVLAVALKGGIGTIVTNNLRDFPSHALTPHGVNAIAADELLAQLVAEYRELIVRKLNEAATARNRSLADLVVHFRRYMSRLSDEISKHVY